MPADALAATMWLAVAAIIVTVLRSPVVLPGIDAGAGVFVAGGEQLRYAANRVDQLGQELGGRDAGRARQCGRVQQGRQGGQEDVQVRLVQSVAPDRGPRRRSVVRPEALRAWPDVLSNVVQRTRCSRRTPPRCRPSGRGTMTPPVTSVRHSRWGSGVRVTPSAGRASAAGRITVTGAEPADTCSLAATAWSGCRRRAVEPARSALVDPGEALPTRCPAVRPDAG